MCSLIKKLLPAALTLALLGAALIWSDAAVAGARDGLELCASVLVPTLLPFFVLSNLLCLLGLPALVGRHFEGLFRALFGVGGEGAAAFVLGVTGGYPLGAASVSQLYASGSIKESEARQLLMFCNNTGPAFIMGMAGTGVFGSVAAGLLLYAVHILAALIAGLLLCRGEAVSPSRRSAVSAQALAPALTTSMLRAVRSSAMISGFVIFFSMLVALMRESGLFTAASGALLNLLPQLGIGRCEALLMGLLELGSGVASLGSLEPEPLSLALAAFILGWGGLCVQLQTAAVLSESGLRCTREAVLGKAAHAVLSAALAFFAGTVFFGA